MARLRLSAMLIVTAVFVCAGLPLRASDPVGVYGIVEKVVFEPAEASATSVQIWGVFSLAVRRLSDGTQPRPAGSYGTSGDVYSVVQKGYLYFTCQKGQEATCRSEWADLKTMAGTHDVAGFGFRYAPSIVLRKATDKPTSPDVYPLNIGVVKMGKYSMFPDLVAALEASLRTR